MQTNIRRTQACNHLELNVAHLTVSWHILPCHGTSYCVMAHLTVSWHILLCHGTSYCVMAHFTVSWHILRCHGTSYCVVAHLTVLWHKYFGIKRQSNTSFHYQLRCFRLQSYMSQLECSNAFWGTRDKYRGADKSLARPGRKQARQHVRDVRNFNNIETRAIIKFSFSCKARHRRKFTPF